MIRDLIIATITSICMTFAAYSAVTKNGMGLDEFCEREPVACIILVRKSTRQLSRARSV